MMRIPTAILIAIVVLWIASFGTSTLQAQSIGGSAIVDDEGEVEMTIAIAGNESLIDGYVEVDNYDFEEDIDYVSAAGEIDDGSNIVSTDGYYDGADYATAQPQASTHVGDTYVLYGLAQACYFSDDEEGDNDFDDCEPLDTLYQVLPTDGPSISSISPTFGAIGDQGKTISVQGQNLDDAFGLSGVTLSGSGVASSVQSVSSDGTRATISYSIASDATVGSQHLTMSTSFGTSNAETFTIVNPSATVTGISPGTWTAGQSYNVEITGTNFGSTPAVSLSDPSITVSAPSNTSSNGSSSTTNIAVSVPSTTPSESVVITVTPGSGGASLTQVPGGPSLSGSNTATVIGTQGAQNGQSSCPAAADTHSGFSGIVAPSNGASGGGTIMVSFSGGSFNKSSVTAPYGQYSTPESMASHLASLITKSYYNSGLSAESFGPYVVYKSTAPLGTAKLTISGSAFAANPSPSACPPVNTQYVLAVFNDSVTFQDVGMNYGRQVEYDLETWPTAANPRGTPPSFTKAIIAEHLTNSMAYGKTSDNSSGISGQFVDILGNTSGSNGGPPYVTERYFTVNADNKNLGSVMTFDRAGKHTSDHIEIHLPKGPAILNRYTNSDGSPKDISLP